MWINRNDNTEIATPMDICIDGVRYPSSIFYKWFEGELNGIGIFTVVHENPSVDERYFDKVEPVKDFESTPPVITTSSVEKSLDEVHARMLGDLSSKFKELSKRPRVTTSLGFDVDGSRNDILNFEDGKFLGLTFVKDADGESQSIELSDWDTIIGECKAYGLGLYQQKWNKEDEVKALADIDACILYESTPFDYILTEEDMKIPFEGSVGDTVTRYKNNTIEW